jgi:hypothetical protein
MLYKTDNSASNGQTGGYTFVSDARAARLHKMGVKSLRQLALSLSHLFALEQA